MSELLSAAQLQEESRCLLGESCQGPLTVIVFGATGDLARKKTFPALFALFKAGMLPRRFTIVGYARSPLTDMEFLAKAFATIRTATPEEEAQYAVFRARCRYVHGSYDAPEALAALHARCVEEEEALKTLRFEGCCAPPCPVHRVFYLALPPHVFLGVLRAARNACLSPAGLDYNRFIVEKPFGRDSASSAALSREITALYPESLIYRIDHYLGKEMVQNVMVMRFANLFLQPLWNRHYISNVQLTFMEPFGTEGRGGYFDAYGIIRDVIQNHLLQIFALVAMERPVSRDPEDIRDEKVKLLRCTRPATLEETVLGQYIASADGSKPGYLDDATVPAGSLCPTFAMTCLRVDNERWSGVPFVLKAGKALEQRKTEVRIQFADVAGQLFPTAARNELVIRVQPDEAIYLKVTGKAPGLGMSTHQTELDLTYGSRYKDLVLPDAYERLIFDVIRSDHENFVRSDELAAAWNIFTPLLSAIEQQRVPPIPYAYGSRGPREADELRCRLGFRRLEGYRWRE